MPLKVLVTDGSSRAALAVTRSLGAAGYEVIVGERESPCLSQASRFCRERLVYPDPTRQSAAFVDAIGRAVRERGIAAVMPVTDVSSMLLSRHRAELGPDCLVPVAEATTLSRAADKIDMVRTAQALGIPVPRSVVVDDPGRVPTLDFPYPVVVKPPRSRVHTPEGWVSCEVGFADSPDALRRQLAARPAHEFPLMVQERLGGPGLGVFACYDQGRLVALFSHRRLRERPPWGGVSVLSESVLPDPVAGPAARRLLDAIGWQGVAMVEFKRDHRDGVPKLMEINGRFWGSLQLAVDSGVDFPVLLLAAARGLNPDPVTSYRLGVRSRWLWGDVDALLLTLFKREARAARDIGRVRVLTEFLRPQGADVHYENPRRQDLGPWWFETRDRMGLASPRRSA